MIKNCDPFLKVIPPFFNQLISENYKCEKIQHLYDGITFYAVLKSVEGLRFNFGEIREKPENWSERMSNLKIIVRKIEDYFQNKLGKGIKTKDINLLQIAMNQSLQEIVKMFEIVLAVLTLASNKEEYIGKIMSMDDQTQRIFVQLIQNINDQRILEANETKQDKFGYIIEQVEGENQILREEISNLQAQRQGHLKQICYLKSKEKKTQDQLENNLKNFQFSSDVNVHASSHNQQLKGLVENLKKKLISVTRQHEIQVYNYKEEINKYTTKVNKLEEICQFYQQKYNESEDLISKAKNWDKQKNKLNRLIEDKETIIKKLQEKVQTCLEENCLIQERQIYLQMQLEKREVRFKELQKEVKKRVNHGDESTFSLSEKSLNESQREEMEEMKTQLQKIKQKERQTYKETNRLKREAQRSKGFEKQKKKLESIILEVSKEKKDEISLLLGVLSDMNTENQRYKRLLEENKIEIK